MLALPLLMLSQAGTPFHFHSYPENLLDILRSGKVLHDWESVFKLPRLWCFELATLRFGWCFG